MVSIQELEEMGIDCSNGELVQGLQQLEKWELSAFASESLEFLEKLVMFDKILKDPQNKEVLERMQNEWQYLEYAPDDDI